MVACDINFNSTIKMIKPMKNFQALDKGQLAKLNGGDVDPRRMVFAPPYCPVGPPPDH